MKYDPKLHHRRSIRLRGHNYRGGGAYFITTCIQTREFLFGRVVEARMELNELGRMVVGIWQSLAARFPQVVLDAFQMMPNHAHGILVIPGPGLEPALAVATGAPIIEPVGPGRAPAKMPKSSSPSRKGTANVPKGSNGAGAPSQNLGSPCPGPTLGDVVGTFKSLSALAVNRASLRTGVLWQEDYFEHIIRDVDDLTTIRDYIVHNPGRWLEDPENPSLNG